MLGVVFEQRKGSSVKVENIVGLAYKSYLEYTVIKQEVVHFENSCDRGGISDHTVNELVLDDFAVAFNAHFFCLDIVELSCSVDHIGSVTKQVLYPLRGVVGYIGKCSEGRNVGETLTVETADIAKAGLAVNDVADGFYGIGGDPEIFCKIVGRTCGNVSYRDTIFALHDSLKALAECTVSACADEQVVTVMAGIFRPFCGIIAALGCVYCYIVSGFCEFVHYCTEFFTDPCLARDKVYNKIHFLHWHLLLFA